MWYLVVVVFGMGPGPVESMMQKTYASRIECQNDSNQRVFAIAGLGGHGRWMCAKQGMKTEQLQKEPKFSF